MIKFLSEANQKKLRGVALLRLDFNTEDDWRLVASLPTLKFLLRRAGKIVILGHRGRPPGISKEFSLKKDAVKLQRLIHSDVYFVPHFDFKKIQEEVQVAPRGSIFILENLRFMKGEVENSSVFAKKLASLADFYVNDAFAVSHRANASVAAITKFLPSFAGFEFEREIAFLSRAMQNPKSPLVFILGGSKVSDKLGILKYFRNKADYFLLGGVAANTILKLKGFDTKKSLVEKDAPGLRKLRAVLGYSNVILPVDFRWSGERILDIGEKTAKFFSQIVSRARTIIWSGPLGLAEKKQYARGSMAVARAVVANRRAFSLSGGGETVMFLKQHGFDKRFSFVSTGGGAMLEFLEGKKLPGVEALKRN